MGFDMEVASIVIAVVAAVTALASAMRFRSCECWKSSCLCGPDEYDDNGKKKKSQSPIARAIRKVRKRLTPKPKPRRVVQIKKENYPEII